METVTKRVQRGAKLLDKEKLGWEKKIRIRQLDLLDCEQCILGQLFGEYVKGLLVLGREKQHEVVDSVTYGFSFGFDSPLEEEEEGLRKAWVDEIRKRRVR